MDVESVRRLCLCFPHVTENLQWEDVLGFKVGGKIFALLSLSSVPPHVAFKCTPEKFAALLEQEGIIPAPYVGRYRWVALQRLGVMPVVELLGLVREAYEVASRVGEQTMKAGGDAIDAALAVGFALAVVHPQAGNLGGRGFMLIRQAGGKTHFVDYRERAPAAATANMYLDAHGNLIEDASTVGYKAIAVPGSVAGMVYAEKTYGKLSLAQVVAPAIKLAEEG